MNQRCHVIQTPQNNHTTRVITSACDTPMILSNTSWNSLRFLDKHNTEMSRPGETEIVSRSLYSIIAIQGIARIMYQRCHVIREQHSHHTRHYIIMWDANDTFKYILDLCKILRQTQHRKTQSCLHTRV